MSTTPSSRLRHFFPLFLMPPPPMGPFAPAFFAASSRAFLSAPKVSVCASISWRTRSCVPAACFALNALSSSSSSLTAFFFCLLWMGFVPAAEVVSGAAQDAEGW